MSSNKKVKNTYSLSAISIAIYSLFFFCSHANASGCESTRYGTIVINNTNNANGCSVSSIDGEIGGPYYNVGFYVYSQYADQIRTLFVEKDIKTVLSGLVGITAFGANGASSFFNARDRNIDLTIKNATDDSSGVEVSFGSAVEIGTLNLHMDNLPSTKKAWIFDIPLTAHYGVLAGSSLKAGEGKEYDEKYSRAVFDNLNISMSSYSDYSNAPLIAGIRAIQGAGNNSGNGSSGAVNVENNLSIDLKAKKNDAVGIYVSGGDSQVNINNSNIKIESQSSRANAILIGKDKAYGTGSGSVVSSGNMIIDTTGAPNSSAISVIWQGGKISADKNSSSANVLSANSVISISGSKDLTGNSETITSFNNLNASTTSENANLIEVEKGQSSYSFYGRGSGGLLVSSPGGYLINVKGDENHLV